MSPAQAMKDRVNRSIEKELDRCKAAMGEHAWNEHEEWITEYVVAEAKSWMDRKLGRVSQ
ncbi:MULTISPECIES: hypothetical protein [unclassified Caballeronia]|uniref:hypothetical protein n=1 Tax=unclassified Caballeronia TaxID=2646786 RepID=UPI0028551E6C|nr:MULTISPECIES: hypothetical protein [unclassified Caballeronia]MDR5770868.1 hypothetical protein [Caballeronia sp. LZ002]MDR5846305.1 hypothetical protein [Caballeronia sp. LZ003]